MAPRSKSDRPFRVFLVEDDEIDVENVRRSLTVSGSDRELCVASDGRAALDMLERDEVDIDSLVILLDLNMPRMNGIEFLRALRASARFSHLPVVVLTTSDDERDKVDAYNLNVAGYILKPITYEAFVTTMDTIESYWRLQELL